MSFDKVWAQLVRKNPNLETPGYKVEIPCKVFKQLLEQVYDQGAKARDTNLDFLANLMRK